LIAEKPVDFNKYVKPACLPKSNDYNFPEANVDSFAVGWVIL
jgi:hypothetical protein